MHHQSAAALKTADMLAHAEREFTFTPADFKFLAQCAYDYAGIALSEGKTNLVYGRLSKRLRTLGLVDFKAYRELLANGGDEIENFINSISTNHTKFFREAHHFGHFAAHVVKPFHHGAGSMRRLRVWSAGCSSGEEPYTIAAVMHRDMPNAARGDVRILATDIDTEIISRALRGLYAPGALDDIPETYRGCFETVSDDAGDHLSPNGDLRSLIRFRQLNLMADWPLKVQFDAIFCRNVMIYFDAPTKAHLIDRFIAQLKPGGFLYIGHAESLTGGHPQLKVVGRTVYRRSA